MTDQQTVRSETSENLPQPITDIWRKEIHARVAGYRTRRGRRAEGAYSMRFPFPPEPDIAGAPEDSNNQEQLPDVSMASAAPTSVIEVVSSEVGELAPDLTAAAPEVLSAESPQERPIEPEPLLAREAPMGSEPLAVRLSRPRPQRKVIAFPRQPQAAPEMLHRLADPVLPEQPRILDVPEELEALPTTPFLDGLQFGPTTQPVIATHADNIELPFRAVGRVRRLYAASMDCVLVGAGTAVFAAVGYKMLPKLIFSKPVVLTAGALPLLLWAIYQYLLLVYGGTTAGMRVAKIRLSTFKEKSPRRCERRHRVLALYFSTASFVMGLLWAFVDVDALCWHDRISRTYLTDRD
jgi:RDD family